MTTRDPQTEAAFSELANALQIALPLSKLVRQEVGITAQDLVTLEAALERAVRAVRELRHREARSDH